MLLLIKSILKYVSELIDKFNSTPVKRILLYTVIVYPLVISYSYQDELKLIFNMLYDEKADVTNLAEAQKSLEFLLLPKEHVFLRPKDHCFDVSTSVDRTNLLEKFLSKHYTLIGESHETRTLDVGNLNNQNCQLELKTIKKKNVDITKAKAGAVNSASTDSEKLSEVSTSQILLGLGKPGSLELEGRSLYVECSGGVRGIYQLIFSYSEAYKGKVSSQLTVRQGEVVNISSITNDLNIKSKTLGLPE